uniref:Uncharacterized protein n=2 Tax=Fusarium oxysporum (strain Fo5176) TaxID=660025 RepID=A0A0D2XRY5_FUSOF
MGLSSYIGSERQIISSAGDESRIANLIAAVDAVMDRCEQTARTTSRSLLCWLRSVRPHVCYAKPFTFVGKAASRKQYIRVLKRFIAMVFRAFNLPADIRRRQAGIRLKKAHIRLISALWNHEIWKQCNTSVEGFWTLIKSSTTTDIEDELDEESNDEERHNDDKISSGYESDATLGFEGSENDDVDDGNSEYEDDETLEQDDIDDHKVETLLGSQSPFEELFSLLAYGRAIAGSETPAFLLRWSDDSQTVSYKDEISVHMEQFRRLPMTLLERAETLSGQLMYGWKPPCDLSYVKDDISNTTHGFSFVSHPKNDLTEAYLELSLKACTSQASPLSRKGKWHHGAILAFLKKEEALREILADLMLMTCGGQPRSPDLLEVRVRNHGTAERSFYVYNGFMIYVTRSHKAKRSTNREFIVARFFPFQVGQLLYTYLVYIRPFVDMLAREHEPYTNECSPYFFRTRPNSDSQCWSTERLTRIVKRFTHEVWDQGVNLRLLRQLCIGITDRHVREVSQPFNRFDDRTDKADRGVTFAWSSGHRPLQRARTYGLDGAFPTHLQPQLLERYEWVSVRWHEFLHMPSRCVSPSMRVGTSSGRQEHTTPDAVDFDDQSHDNPFQSPPQSSPTVSLSSAMPSKRDRQVQSSLKRRATTTLYQTPVKRRPNRFAELLSSMANLTDSSQKESTTHMFGHMCDFGNSMAAQEYEMIVSYLESKQVEIRPLDKNEVEIVVSGDSDRVVSNQPFTAAPFLDLNDRLSWIHKTTEDWKFVGCELCFINKGEREPDHGLENCEEWPASKHAKRILSWLITLKIPRYYDTRGACSMCGHGWLVCGEMRHGELIRRKVYEEDAGSQEADLMESRDATSNYDGYCENTPVVRRMIAALCAYDNQILGKVLTKTTLDHENLDLTLESQARQWLEQRILSPDDYWMSRLVYVLDQLVVAYDFRRSKGRVAEHNDRTIDLKCQRQQSDDLEVRNWRAALDWLKGRCSFCAGRGLRGAHICHTLRQCNRGGAIELVKGLGEMFYDEGFTPSTGCELCNLPYLFCARWRMSSQGEWTLEPGGRCTYERHLLCDSIIGFISCGARYYEEDLLQEVSYKAAVRPGAGIESHFRFVHQLKAQVLKDIKDYFSTLELADPNIDFLPTQTGH